MVVQGGAVRGNELPEAPRAAILVAVLAIILAVLTIVAPVVAPVLAPVVTVFDDRCGPHHGCRTCDAPSLEQGHDSLFCRLGTRMSSLEGRFDESGEGCTPATVSY
jgi:hypothetical protein